ncbi:MAG: PIN domain-containing protein [Candidatus Competibacterales bacterium]|nr:PIN domain-containing protein [Candidatus Competibacterales bacterium]
MILIDLNVLLDVLQKREPHYQASAAVIEQVVAKRTPATLPVHAITTVHYIVERYQDTTEADRAVDWLLKHFTIVSIGHAELLRARSLNCADFEDAVVAAAAETAACTAIITRNVKDFRDSPVPALTPEEYLLDVNHQS